MPPTIPESDFEAMEDKMDPTNNKKYVYDIKFEVVLKEETKTIPGKTSLVKSLMAIKNSKRKHEKIDFFDTNGLQISPDLRGIEQTEIEGRFCMETGGKDTTNLYFGCTIQTNIPFSVIKGRTIEEYKRHGVFFKIHRGGFKHGVNWSPIGFFLKQHPGFVDNVSNRDKLMEKIVTSWNDDGETFDDDQKKKIAKIIDPDSHLESFDPSTIPFELIQSSITAKNEAEEKIRTNAVVVTVPHQFYKVGIMIMDYLAITSEKIDNYIPLGYKKEEPESFYELVQDHDLWMEQARNLAITNVPTSNDYTEVTNQNNETLESILKNIPGIDNVSYIRNQKQLNVTIVANKLPNVSNLVKEALATNEFPYKPYIAKKFNPTGSLGSNKSGTSKYSAAMSKYKTARSPNSSVATSNGDSSRLTSYTGRTWGNVRKVPKVIDFSDATEFPPLQPTTNPKATTNNYPQTQSTINDESITDTTVIQQAIDAALKKAYDEHRQELLAMQKRFDTQMEELKKQQNTTSLETKFDRLLEMLTIDSTQITRESPLRKKGKPNNLEQTAFSQRETPIRSNKHDITMEVEECEQPLGLRFDTTHESPPRNNINTSNSNKHDKSLTKQQDNVMEIEEEELTEYPHPHHVPLPASPQRNTETIIQADRSTVRTSEGEWITKEKKDKRSTRTMTQTKISDTMINGGYGTQRNSPSREKPQSPSRLRKTTPNRPGRGTPPRPVQAEKDSGSKVILTTLSSSRGGPTAPHGREN
jgi:hypothetical protein